MLFVLNLWELNALYFFLKVIEAGANALVAGSAVFGAKDYAEGIYYTFLCTLSLKCFSLVSNF